MKLGIRSKLFIVSVFLLVVSVGVAGVILIGDLRSELEKRIEAELERHARTTLTMLELMSTSTATQFDLLADLIGQSSGLRITIIDDQGVVLGDSDVEAANLPKLENHSRRPEVVEAHNHGRGWGRRYSTTLGTDMLYVAVRSDSTSSERPLIVRTARPLREVDDSVALLRRRLAMAALIGLLIAIFLGALTSHWMTRLIRELAGKARTIAFPDAKSRPFELSQRDELGHLAGSLDRLSDQIETTVSELAAERARFATVLESMEEGVLALDGKQTIKLVNQSALQLLKLTESPEGRRLSDIIRTPALVELVTRVSLETSPTVEVEIANHRWIHARATLSANEPGCVLVLRDITEIHRLETVRRDFVANVSHELRTPLSVISANSETLLATRASLDPAKVKLLGAVHRNSIRMAQLVTDLLDLSRIEAGRFKLDIELLDLEPLVQASIAAVKEQAKQQQTTIVVEPAAPKRILADRHAIDQVLVNLLDNAIKYTSRPGLVTIRIASLSQFVRIEIEDNGPGIAAEHRARIFERFYRIDRGRSRDMGGTGLGLSIVRHLVENMNGTVGVKRGHEIGSLFWLELPCDSKHEDNSQPIEIEDSY